MKNNDPHRVTRSTGWTVAPSPFDPVKLDLGIILIVGLILLLVQNRALDHLMTQFLILGSYGILGMFWLLLRTRRILSRLTRERHSPTPHGPQ